MLLRDFRLKLADIVWWKKLNNLQGVTVASWIMARSIPSAITPPPPPPAICRTFAFWFQNCGKCPTVGSAYAYKCLTVGLWMSANDQPAEHWRKQQSLTNKCIFYRICNSSNRFLTAQLIATLSHTVFFFLSSVVRKGRKFWKYLHMLDWNPWYFWVAKDREVCDNAPPQGWPSANTPPG